MQISQVSCWTRFNNIEERLSKSIISGKIKGLLLLVIIQRFESWKANEELLKCKLPDTSYLHCKTESQ